MTENQIYPMSADFFDTSSNSSNTLKFDLFSLGSGLTIGSGGVSSSNSILCGGNTHLTLSPPLTATSQNNSNIGVSINTTTDGGIRENLMLTNAISIPRSNNTHHNQLHHHPLHYHQLHQPKIMTDLTDICLDALDASSLSPTLLQDVSLSASALSSHHGNTNGNMLFPSELSPLSNNSSNGGIGSINSNNGGNANITFDNHQATPNSNTMWSDIGSAIIATKNEPFSTEDDYIFPNDKAEIQEANFPDLYDENLLEDLNIEDLMSPNQGNFMLSPNVSGFHQLQTTPQLPSPQPSPAGPPQQLLEQQQQQQQQQQQLRHNQRLQEQHQQQQQQQHSLSLQLHHNSFDEHRHNTARHHGSSSPYEIYHSTPHKQMSSNTAFSPGSQASPNSPLIINSVTPPPPPHGNRSHYSQNIAKSRNVQMLKKEFSMSPDRNNSTSQLGQSVPAPSLSHMLLSGTALSPGSSGFGSAGRKSLGSDTSSSRLSSSAPTHLTHLGFDQIWVRREPRQHLLSTGSLVEADSYSSISTGSVLSPEANDFSQDDEGYSDYDSDHYEDLSSDNGSDNDDDNRTSTPNQLSSSKGKERFFWQYNVQAKGPKGKRLVFQSKLEDPHVLNEATDPVFSPNCSVRGIKVYKHSGKARKGDGNDLTPNPRKLHSIGKELDKLSRTINDMTPVSELPFNVRPKSRKEKNKLASRACRLKKKAQHEANKIKLHGLEIEHKRLLNGINDIKQALAIKYQNQGEPTDKLDEQIEQIYKNAINCYVFPAGLRIAGDTTDFVNTVLDNIKKGITNGGLEDLRNT